MVRPDGHVAWRGDSVDDDPAAILATAVWVSVRRVGTASDAAAGGDA
ncbi:hypothetical protein [Nocardia sp. NPDC052112]